MLVTFQSRLKVLLSTALLFCSLSSYSRADVVVTVDPGATWLGFMNVFELDRSGPLPAQGSFSFASGWGFNDLTASFDVDGCLVLGVNTIGDPDPFWYIGGGGPGALGNKWMDANGYVQQSDNPSFTGTNVTFTGDVKENSFLANHTATAFIRDFAPDFSSFNEVTMLLNPGVFSINLLTDPGSGRHVQYGFNVAGENVWVTDAPSFGIARIGAVPEPSSFALLGLCTAFSMVRRRK